MSRVLIRPEAKKDLQGVRAYTIRVWGRPQTKIYLAAIHQHFIELARNPLLHPLVDDRVDGVRRSRSGRHIIAYMPIGDSIEIVRVLHERMDIDVLLANA